MPLNAPQAAAAMADRKPRGELAELSAQLQGLCSTGKRSKQELAAAKREAFKKVISYMTLGMDMSGLFPMMISCSNLSPGKDAQDRAGQGRAGQGGQQPGAPQNDGRGWRGALGPLGMV